MLTQQQKSYAAKMMTYPSLYDAFNLLPQEQQEELNEVLKLYLEGNTADGRTKEKELIRAVDKDLRRKKATDELPLLLVFDLFFEERFYFVFKPWDWEDIFEEFGDDFFSRVHGKMVNGHDCDEETSDLIQKFNESRFVGDEFEVDVSETMKTEYSGVCFTGWYV